MILLFNENERSFKNNGIGSLSDALTCIVEEQLNGEFELEMEYPINGIRYSEIKHRRIIYAKPNPFTREQPFRIYEISKPINGIVTINAEHISYDLSGIPVEGLIENYAENIEEVYSYIRNHSIIPCNFNFYADAEINKINMMNLSKPRTIRSILGTDDNSVLSLYGGEYEFDNYDVRLHKTRGEYRNVTIKYGLNMTDVKQEENSSNVYSAIYPYYYAEDDGIMEVEEKIVDIPYSTVSKEVQRVLPVDFTNMFEEMPTSSELRIAASTYIEENKLLNPDTSLSVSYITYDEIPSYLRDVQLGDTVHVYYPELEIDSTKRCITTKYDAITDRYESIELGEKQDTLSSTVVSTIKKQETTQEQLEEESDRAVNAEEELGVQIQRTDDSLSFTIGRYDGKFSEFQQTIDGFDFRVDGIDGRCSEIEQTADGIKTTVEGLDGQYTELEQTVNGFSKTVTSLDGRCSNIEQNANGIKSTVEDIDGRCSTLEQNAYGISSKVEGIGTQCTTLQQAVDGFNMSVFGENGLATRVTITENGLNSKVGNGEVCSEINQSQDEINLTGNRVTIMSTSFNLTKDGTIMCSSGYIGALSITGDGLEGTGHGVSRNTKIQANTISSSCGDFDTVDASSFLSSDGPTEIGNGVYPIEMLGEIIIHNPASTSSSTANARINDGGKLAKVSSSSKRYKHDVVPIIDYALDPHNLYNIGIYQYKFNSDYLSQNDLRYGVDVPGFIAEDVYEHYPIATEFNEMGQIENWNERFIIPPMLKLIQEQHKEIEYLKNDVNTLKQKMEETSND